MKLLIAEDDAASRRILKLTLEKSGHEVDVAADGAEAWDSFCRHPPEAVVSDWMMPRMDGLELCRRIRETARKDYTYFILLTAKSSHEEHVTAMQEGVDDFLTKPLRPQELLLRLRVAERILNFIGQVRELKKLLPICAYCKKIRDDKDYWHQIESYIHAQTGTDFTHSICPDCVEKVIRPQLKRPF